MKTSIVSILLRIAGIGIPDRKPRSGSYPTKECLEPVARAWGRAFLGTPPLLGMVFGLFLGSQAPALADSHARAHSWSMEKGSFVPNWSFENELDGWLQDEPFGGMNATARHAPLGFPARSGAFVGRISGTTNTSSPVNLLRTDRFKVIPGQTYTVSFYVRSSGAVSAGCFPGVFLYPDASGYNSYFPGPSYATFSGSSTISDWTLYAYQFTIPSNIQYAHVGLWRTMTSGVSADLFFDEVMLEEGSYGTSQVAARRARNGYSVTFSDALGRVHQTQTRLSDGNYRVEAAVYDSGGRPEKTVVPFAFAWGDDKPEFFEDPVSSASAYYYYQVPMPGLSGNPFSEVRYAAEPGARVIRSAAPGSAWAMDEGRNAESGFHFVGTLAIPSTLANITAPAMDNAERLYRLDWSRDEDSAFTLSWTNRKGQVVQTATRADGNAWAITKTDYYPAGGVRRVRTPLDTSGLTFAEVRNYNAAGHLTSSYGPDRGLMKFWYNKRGMLRYTQDDIQREKHASLAIYQDYDHLGNLVSTGEQVVYYLDQSIADGDSVAGGKTESRGWLYGSLDDFGTRTGMSLDSIPNSSTISHTSRDGALRAAWNRNHGSDAPGFSEGERLVVDFFEYDERGNLSRQHKYLGAMREYPLQTTGYAYDETDRLIHRGSYQDGGTYDTLMEQSYFRDGLGRVIAITGLGDTVARYEYFPHGPMRQVGLGRDGAGPGTTVSYDYHARGWTRQIEAVRAGNGFKTYLQALGYEDRPLDEAGVPALIQPRYTGQITQQLYKFTGDVSNPVRAVNYVYDRMGRMTLADYRHGTDLDSTGALSFPLSLSNVNDLDTRVAYDMNGRITGKRSGGVSSADSAVYEYHAESYRLSSVQGKLSSQGTRDASRYENFRYDELGRMTGDLSKALEVAYGQDGMPLEMAVRAGQEETALHPLYDALGYRVSQVAATRLAHGFPAYWVGTREGNEPDGMYTASSIEEALSDASFLLYYRNYPAPDSLVLYVVPDLGQTEMAHDLGELTPLMKGDTVIPVVLRGVVKDSPQYATLMAAREGRRLHARHEVSMDGWIAGEVREVYDTAGAVASSRAVGNVYGRGAPIGRVVETDTGTAYQFYVKNHLGSTVRMVNADGSYATTPVFDYQPYGELLSIREDSLNPVGPKYTGKGLDTEVNLYYFGARWYDAELGMWISPDAYREFFNPYGRSGNPVLYVDQDGNCELVCIALIVGGVYLGGAIAQNWTSNDETTWNPVDWQWDEPGTYVGMAVGGVAGYGLSTGMAALGIEQQLTFGYEGLNLLTVSELPSGALTVGGGVVALAGTGVALYNASSEQRHPGAPNDGISYPSGSAPTDDWLPPNPENDLEGYPMLAGIETPLDVLSLAHSAWQYKHEQNLANLGMLAWDMAAVGLPFIPGSYAWKGYNAARGTSQIIASNGTRITGFTRHGIDRAVGGGASRAGVKPAAVLDALKHPNKIDRGVRDGRPFEVFHGQDARVVVNPQTGKIISVNPMSGAGAH